MKNLLCQFIRKLFRGQHARKPARRRPLCLESLEQRLTPADLAIDAAGNAILTAVGAPTNDFVLSLDLATGRYTFTDTLNPVTFSGAGSGAAFADAQNAGPNSVTALNSFITSIVLSTGDSSDVVLVRGTADPTTVTSADGNDTVTLTTIGNFAATVNVTTVVGLTSLVIDNSADPTGRTATLSAASLSGLAPADITFDTASLNGFTITSGSGNDNFTVTNTPGSLNILNLGGGDNSVTVTGNGAGSRLNLNGQGGDDSFTMVGSTVADISVDGGPNTSGDRLIYIGAGTDTPAGAGAGTVSEPGFNDVVYANIETVTIFASSDVVVDAGAAKDNGTADTFVLNAQGSNTQVLVNGAVVVSLPTSFLTSVTLLGSADVDTFNVTPSPTVPITVMGGAPTPAATPGDTLNVDTSGASNPALTINSTANGFQGSYTFGNRATVTFSEIETLPPASVLITLANNRNFYVDDRGLFEFSFGTEKWLQGDVNAFGNTFYFIRPNGDLVEWNGAGLNGNLLVNVGTNGWENPELIVNASTLAAANPVEVAAADQVRGFYRASSGNFYFNSFGGQEKWIKGLVAGKSQANRGNNFYFILPNGTVHEWDGTGGLNGPVVPGMQADVNLYQDPSLLYDALQDPTVGVASAALDQVLALYFDRSGGLARNLFENVFGSDERWFVGNLNGFSNQFYLLLPNGDLREWNGSGAAAGTLLGNLGPNAWNNFERVVSAFKQVMPAQVVALDQQLSLFRFSRDVDYFFDSFGVGDKWLIGAFNSFGNRFYILLENDSLLEWNGTGSATGNILAQNLPRAIYDDPLLLADAFADGGILDNAVQLDPFGPNAGGQGDHIV